MNASERLYNVRGELIRLKRWAKEKHGSNKDKWPLDVRNKYEYLKQVARDCQEQLAA